MNVMPERSEGVHLSYSQGFLRRTLRTHYLVLTPSMEVAPMRRIRIRIGLVRRDGRAAL